VLVTVTFAPASSNDDIKEATYSRKGEDISLTDLLAWNFVVHTAPIISGIYFPYFKIFLYK
jgi:hypothetical protein